MTPLYMPNTFGLMKITLLAFYFPIRLLKIITNKPRKYEKLFKNYVLSIITHNRTKRYCSEQKH